MPPLAIRRLHRLLCGGPFEGPLRRVALFAAYGLWPHVRGARHVPRDGPLVVAPSHAGPAEISLHAIAVRRRIEFVVHDEYARRPALGPLLALRGVHALRRVELGFDEGNAAVLARAAEEVRRGTALVMFPQGLTHRVGGGVARLAAATGAPVLPVLTYRLWRRRAPHRALVLVRRPLDPPEADARARRRFTGRLRRRLGTAGALRGGDSARAVLDVVLDDRILWRAPLRVARACARVQRLPAGARMRLARRARGLQRGCRALRCSPDDLRHPPGVTEAILFLALAAPAFAAVALFAPVLLAALLWAARAPHGRREIRYAFTFLCALPWSAALAAGGAVAWGAAGILLPLAAAAGFLALGAERRLYWRVVAMPRVRRQGHRLRPLLEEVRAAAEYDRSRP